MESPAELFNVLFHSLYTGIGEPLLKLIARLLRTMVSPLQPLDPFYQILVIAFVAAGISSALARRFRLENKTSLQKAFQARLKSLHHIPTIEDETIRSVVKKGINDQADKIYEQLILDTFFQVGYTYLLPFFCFLIWIEYDLFPAHTLEVVTGSATFQLADSGWQVSAAVLFGLFFNGCLMSISLVKAGLRITTKRVNLRFIKSTKQHATEIPH